MGRIGKKGKRNGVRGGKGTGTESGVGGGRRRGNREKEDQECSGRS